MAFSLVVAVGFGLVGSADPSGTHVGVSGSSALPEIVGDAVSRSRGTAGGAKSSAARPVTPGKAAESSSPSYVYWIQVGAHVDGLLGSRWRSDIGILNANPAPATIQVRLYRADDPDVHAISRMVAAGAQKLFEDVVGQMVWEGAGAIEVRSDLPVQVTSRTYNLIAATAQCSAGGTLGQLYPAIPAGGGLRCGDVRWLPRLAESARFRSNIAFTNAGEEEARILVELFAGAGGTLASFTVTLAPHQYRQETRVFMKRAGATDLEAGFARLTVLSGRDVVISASLVDNITQDPVTILPQERSASLQERITVILPGGVPLELVRIHAGAFTMGSPETERGRDSDEGPPHQVTIADDYFMGSTEVTQEQWSAVMGNTQSFFSSCGPDCPVEQVSWDDIAGPTGFLARLNEHLALTVQTGAGAFRLPTEAEWEYAARAGNPGPFSFGDDGRCAIIPCDACPLFDEYMWWCGNAGGTTHPVGQKRPNAWGLYDMHGNVWEWVDDLWGNYGGPVDPGAPDPSPTAPRVTRGGSWYNYAQGCRSAFRLGNSPDFRYSTYGFRVALTP